MQSLKEMASARNKRLVDTLLAIDPHCYWCKCAVSKYPLSKHQKTPDNYATLDHMFSRYNSMRGKTNNGIRVNVLACYKCNLDRCKAETKAIGLLELHKRARCRKEACQICHTP